MKPIMLCVCCVAMVAFVSRLANAENPIASPQATTSPSDKGTDMVVAFYKALVQEQAPTLEQENSLFQKPSGLQSYLVDQKQGTDKDPVVLLCLRKHRELFLPKGRTLDNVMVTSTFEFVRSVNRLKERPKPGQWHGYVIVTFSEVPPPYTGGEKPPEPSVRHEVVFPVSEQGINPDGVTFEGINGKFLDSLLMGQ